MKKETQQLPPEIAAEIQRQEGKGRRIVGRIINILLAIAIVIAAICTYASYVSTSGNGVPNLFGIRFLSVQTDSMYPQILPGDMIFDTAIPDTSRLQVGDVIMEIDGTDVTSSDTITAVVVTKSPGDTVTLTVGRPSTGKTFTATVTLVQVSGN